MVNVVRNMSKALLSIFVALILTQISEAKDWRGIVPLRSTRADVERLLGAPEKDSRGVYRTDSERITVFYAERLCDYGWKVPLGAVISFSVYPKNPPKIADLKLDESKYVKRRDNHIESIYYYINEKEGINYTVDVQAGVVTSIEYYPAAKDNSKRCAPVKKSKAKTKNTSN